jgi:hypothetical protein
MSTTSNPDDGQRGQDAGTEPERPADEPEVNEPGLSQPAEPEPSHVAVGIGVTDSPDSADHHGQDQGRDTLSVGEAQRTPGGLGTEQEQHLPGMAQNDASEIEKVSGIVAQTRADVGTESIERIARVLSQRLEQSGIDLPDADVQELAKQVSTGDA